MFFIDADGVLRNNPKNGGEPRLVVPKTLVDEVLGLSYDLPVMGHQGVSRTYLRVKEKFSNILVMVDQFTKWVECIALPSQTAEVTARAAVNEFFARFGFSFNIFTDQGRNFESRLFKSICDIHCTSDL